MTTTTLKLLIEKKRKILTDIFISFQQERNLEQEFSAKDLLAATYFVLAMKMEERT
jgi:hypothetical protein